MLIRALAPLEGVELMRVRRSNGSRVPADAALCRGPGNLTRALGIALDQNRADLTGRLLWVEDRGHATGRIRRGVRIGIRVGTERPWRFWLLGHPALSGPRAANAAQERS